MLQNQKHIFSAHVATRHTANTAQRITLNALCLLYKSLLEWYGGNIKRTQWQREMKKHYFKKVSSDINVFSLNKFRNNWLKFVKLVLIHPV